MALAGDLNMSIRPRGDVVVLALAGDLRRINAQDHLGPVISCGLPFALR